MRLRHRIQLDHFVHLVWISLSIEQCSMDMLWKENAKLFNRSWFAKLYLFNFGFHWIMEKFLLNEQCTKGNGTFSVANDCVPFNWNWFFLHFLYFHKSLKIQSTVNLMTLCFFIRFVFVRWRWFLNGRSQFGRSTSGIHFNFIVRRCQYMFV